MAAKTVLQYWSLQVSKAGQKEGISFYSVVCILAHGIRYENTDHVSKATESFVVLLLQKKYFFYRNDIS